MFRRRLVGLPVSSRSGTFAGLSLCAGVDCFYAGLGVMEPEWKRTSIAWPLSNVLPDTGANR